MVKNSAEYEALDRFVSADKRYRKFLYLLTFAFFILVILGGLSIMNSINHKIDGLVSGSVARGNARQQESKVIAEETTRYLTCIFVIPIEERSPANQQRCFDAADLPGGLSRGDFIPYVTPDDAKETSVVPARASSSSASSSSPHHSTPSKSAQSNTSPQTAATTGSQPQTTPNKPQASILSRILNALKL